MKVGPMTRITGEDIQFCQTLIAEYEAKAVAQDILALTCKPGQRGAYRSHAVQNRKSKERMEGNLNIQLAWLKRYNPDLHAEVTNE